VPKASAGNHNLAIILMCHGVGSSHMMQQGRVIFYYGSVACSWRTLATDNDQKQQ